MREVELQAIEQDLLVLVRTTDALVADLDPFPCGQDDVNKADLGQLVQHSPRLFSQPSLAAELPERLPQDVRSEERRVGKGCRGEVLTVRGTDGVRLERACASDLT